jgi:magnesium transporter
MYYVCFSTATIVASLILFQGFNTTSGTNTLSLLTGFVVTFLGVHLLNLSRRDDNHLPPSTERPSIENALIDSHLNNGRLSMDGGWPASPHALGLNGVPGHVRRGSRGSLRNSFGGGNAALFNAHDGEQDGAFVLGRLGEEEEEEEGYAENSDERSRLNPAKRDRPRDIDGDLERTSGSDPGERIAR